MNLGLRDVFFNPDYGRLYEDADGTCNTFCFNGLHGSMQNTFMLRKINIEFANQTYYDIITPYGYGGPIILECEDLDLLMAEYEQAFSQYCRKRNIVAEFVRFHLFDNTTVRERYYGVTSAVSNNVIVDTTGTYEEIRMRYEYKVRKNVKKALSCGLDMISNDTLDDLDTFLDIYYMTMERNHADQYYYFKRAYFENLAKSLPGNYRYFHVLKAGRIISTELVLCSEKYAYSFLGGTDAEFYPMRPNDYLKDAIIKWCNETGREKFILGGGYHKDDGIYQYKRSFTQMEDVPFYVGKAVFIKDIYDRLVELRAANDEKFDRNSSYFPLYRA